MRARGKEDIFMNHVKGIQHVAFSLGLFHEVNSR